MDTHKIPRRTMSVPMPLFKRLAALKTVLNEPEYMTTLEKAISEAEEKYKIKNERLQN